MTAHGGLSWYGGAGIRYAFNEHVHLRMGSRLRFVEQVSDPGDSFLTAEMTLGLTFVLGDGK